jgi:alpha-beta hydrolase superfamily lysophospholipase
MKPISKTSSCNWSRLRAASVAVALGLAGCASPTAPTDPAAPIAPEIGSEMFRASDATALPMRSWLPAGKPTAIIVALHGFADYSASFNRPAGAWAAHGIATYAYDQRGFGGSPHMFHWAGERRMAADAKEIVAAIRRRYPGVPTYLLGESMGGAVAIVACSGPDPVQVDGVVLVSPAVWEHDLTGAIERSALGIATFVLPNLWLEPPRVLNIHTSDNITMLRAMARDSLVQSGARADTTAGLMDLMDDALAQAPSLRKPALVLYGAHEEVLPKAAVEALVTRLPATATVAEYPAGYHLLLRDLGGDIASADIVAWIQNRHAPLPSGGACRGFASHARSCARG